MTQNYPTVPTLDLVCEWVDSYYFGYSETHYGYEQAIAEAAVKWAYEQRQQEIQAAADAELEACCEWLGEDVNYLAQQLRDIRRPKVQTLNQRARSELAAALAGGNITPERAAIIRIALEEIGDATN